MDPDDARLYLNIEWLDFGSLELTKKNTNQDLIDGAKFNIKSVSYDGYNENTVVLSFSTLTVKVSVFKRYP